MSIRVALIQNATLAQVAGADLKAIHDGLDRAGLLLVAQCKRNMVEMHRNATTNTMKSIHHIVDDKNGEIALTVGGNDNLFRVMTGIPPADQGGVFPFKDILHWVELKHFATIKELVVNERGEFEFAHVFIQGRSASNSDRPNARTGRRKRFTIAIRSMRPGIISAGERKNGRGAGTWKFNGDLTPDIPGGNGRRGSKAWGNYEWIPMGDRMKGASLRRTHNEIGSDLEKQENDIAWAVKSALDAFGTRRWRGLEKDPIGEAVRTTYPRMAQVVLSSLREARP